LGAATIRGNCEDSLARNSSDCGGGFEQGSSCDRLSATWYAPADACLGDGERDWMAALPRLAVFRAHGLRWGVMHGGVTAVNRFLWPNSPEAEFAEEIAALEAISGPLRVVLQNLCLKTAINEQAALVQALDRSDSGVEFAVLDQRLQVQRASRRLRDLFRHLPAGSRQLAQLRTAARDLERQVARGGDVHTPIELAGKLNAELRIVRGREESHFVLVVPDARRDGTASLPPPRPREAVGITRREQDVVEQVASGLSNAQVASVLGISIRTVENHLRAIYDKLGVNSRTQLIHRVYDY